MRGIIIIIMNNNKREIFDCDGGAGSSEDNLLPQSHIFQPLKIIINNEKQ